MFWHPECDCLLRDMKDPITSGCDWLAGGPQGTHTISAQDHRRSTTTADGLLISPPSPITMGPHPCPDRAWLARCLEATAESLRELHVMRREAEERVRRAMEDERTSPEWQRNVADMSRVRGKSRRIPDSEKVRAKSTELEYIEEEVTGVRERRVTPNPCHRTSTPDLHFYLERVPSDPQHVPGLVQDWQQKMILRDDGSKEIQERIPAERHPMGANGEGTGYGAQEKPIDEHDREVFQPTESPFLRRIGSGSLAPRLRLGSSGVTSDLLFTRRFSGNCLSTHSSGFYENSDLDSISSSCSSLCSDSSCHTSFSMMSPHRSSMMRPRSTDYTNERRKELQNARAQPRRPISAGALEGFSLSSISSSRYDISQYNDRTTCDYTYSTPPLCAIQQRRKAERYICKLALKYRCKPGVTNPLPDLGPPTPRTPVSASLYAEYSSCPPSPHINSLSASLVDVRKTPKGSWGRLFSRVMLKKDSRIAASELNLQHCISNPRSGLGSPSLADGQLVRAKSFRDLLSVNPFKRSQKSLNKLW